MLLGEDDFGMPKADGWLALDLDGREMAADLSLLRFERRSNGQRLCELAVKAPGTVERDRNRAGLLRADLAGTIAGCLSG